MKRRSTAVRLLARIDRKLGLLVRHYRAPEGSALTIADAARTANVSETTIRRAVRTRNDRDRLAAFDVALGKGKAAWRIKAADLDAWMKRREGGVTPPARPMTRAKPGQSRHFKF